MDHLSNEEVLTLYQASEVRGFNEFYKRTSPILYNYLTSVLKSRVDADDALQETFFRIHKSVATFDPQQNALAWVFTIARNVALRQMQKRVTQQSQEPIEGADDLTPERVVAARQQLQQLLANLKESDRQLLIQRFINDQSYEQLSQQLQVTEQGVRQRISRLIRKIKVGV